MDQPPNHHTLYSQFRPQDYGQGTWNSGYQTQPDPNGQWQQPQPNEHIPWDATRQNPSGHWPQQPSAYTQQSIARAEDWVVNQPNTPAPPPTVPTIGSPPPKTPHSEFGTENSYPFPSTARAQAGREEKKNRIWGIKRPIFFVIVAIGIFVLVVGIATGLGVGLALGRNSNANTAGSAAVETSSTSSSSFSLPASSTASSRASGTKNAPVTPTPTGVTTTTQPVTSTTRSSSTPSVTGVIVPGPIFCPQNNNTVYVATKSSRPFNVHCGRDYNSGGGAVDISNKETITMAECIDLCGSSDDCVGVGWGNFNGKYTCWMKSALGKPNVSKDWYFATLQALDQG